METLDVIDLMLHDMEKVRKSSYTQKNKIMISNALEREVVWEWIPGHKVSGVIALTRQPDSQLLIMNHGMYAKKELGM